MSSTILLNLFMVLPLFYEDYSDLCVEAAIEGITVEEYLEEYIRKTIDVREVSLCISRDMYEQTGNNIDSEK